MQRIFFYFFRIFFNASLSLPPGPRAEPAWPALHWPAAVLGVRGQQVVLRVQAAVHQEPGQHNTTQFYLKSKHNIIDRIFSHSLLYIFSDFL